jgi:predicted metal-binding membrane protein
MDKLQKVLLISLISVSSVCWLISIEQPDTMNVMMTYDPIAISLFTVIWTAGMAAMMFPAISPMVLFYNRLIKTNNNGESITAVVTAKEKSYPFKIILFVSSYLAVWALTGMTLLLAWSIPMNNIFLMGNETKQLEEILYGIVLIIAGVYQFSPLKKKCLGYCESPMSFFMRRWRNGAIGAVKMGTYHGLYCLGCCWAYFLLMIALGWMNLLWMGLFAGIIFGEKVWSKGILVARVAGTGFVMVGLLTIFGLITINVVA